MARSKQLRLFTAMQWSVHPPSSFIDKHCDRLLPGWSAPVQSVAILLQRCPIALLERTPATEWHKDDLRQQFLALGNAIVLRLRQMGQAAELFDPKTGLPMSSLPGQLRLDDVAVVRSHLGYGSMPCGDCAIVLHPEWGEAVYPSTLVSSAAPEVVAAVVRAVVGERGSSAVCCDRLEYHHSRTG